MPLTREEAEKLVVTLLHAQTDLGIAPVCSEDYYIKLLEKRDRLRDRLLAALCADPNAALLGPDPFDSEKFDCDIDRDESGRIHSRATLVKGLELQIVVLKMRNRELQAALAKAENA